MIALLTAAALFALLAVAPQFAKHESCLPPVDPEDFT
jgi:hypothetical protein